MNIGKSVLAAGAALSLVGTPALAQAGFDAVDRSGASTGEESENGNINPLIFVGGAAAITAIGLAISNSDDDPDSP